MQTVTINVTVPDELLNQFHALPDGDRRAWLEGIDAFAVASLKGRQVTQNGAEEAGSEEVGSEEEEWPDDIYERHPLPPSLTQPLGEMLRQGFEAADAGRVIDGETFLADLRQRANAVRAAK